jgi:putative membrane protein insertion efficiency factor
MRSSQFVALRLLRAYKWAISPLLPPACRFVPTCSEYAMEAVERFGALRGGWMALKRLLRCHPLGRSGYDPVMRTPGRIGPESHSRRIVAAGAHSISILLESDGN